MLEARRAEFVAPDGLERGGPSIDRLVWYAGWADKLAQVLGSSNPVAGPYCNFSAGADRRRRHRRAGEPPLAGLVSRIAPVIVGGNTTVVLASEASPAPPSSSPRRSPPRTSRAGS